MAPGDVERALNNALNKAQGFANQIEKTIEVIHTIDNRIKELREEEKTLNRNKTLSKAQWLKKWQKIANEISDLERTRDLLVHQLKAHAAAQEDLDSRIRQIINSMKF